MTNRWAQVDEALRTWLPWANMGGSIAPQPLIVSYPKYGGGLGQRETMIFSAQVGRGISMGWMEWAE